MLFIDCSRQSCIVGILNNIYLKIKQCSRRARSVQLSLSFHYMMQVFNTSLDCSTATVPCGVCQPDVVTPLKISDNSTFVHSLVNACRRPFVQCSSIQSAKLHLVSSNLACFPFKQFVSSQLHVPIHFTIYFYF